MIKKIVTLLLILVVFLTACQSAATSPTAITPNLVGEDAPSTELPPLPEVSATPSTEQIGDPGDVNCTVISRQPTPGPTEQSLVPSVSESDWTHGPADAKVTIIEYGDFQ